MLRGRGPALLLPSHNATGADLKPKPPDYYRLVPLGTLGDGRASIPQSIDSSGDVAGLSGSIADAESINATGTPRFPGQQAGGNADVFLYSHHEMYKLRSPSGGRRLFPLNAVVINANEVAATFSQFWQNNRVFGMGNSRSLSFVASERKGRVRWARLPTPAAPPGDDGAITSVVVTSSAANGRLTGWAWGRCGVGCSYDFPILWTDSESGFRVSRGRIGLAGDLCDTCTVETAGDADLDSVGYGNSKQRGSPWYWPRGSSGRALPPTMGEDVGRGLLPVLTGVAEGDISQRGVQRVYVLGDAPERPDLALWTVGVRTGPRRRVVWMASPRLIHGSGQPSRVNDGYVTPQGTVVGSIATWRRRDFAWCVQLPRATCWSSHWWQHAFLNEDGHTYDLNQRVVGRSGWVVEDVTMNAGFDYPGGTLMNESGDIVAVAYRRTANRALERACRLSAKWVGQRRQCRISAGRGQEEAVLLLPLR